MTDHLAGIGRSMVRGAAWTISARVSVKTIGLVSTIILARLLVPEHFGLVAMSMLLVGALQAASEFGFRNVLIYYQNASRSEYDTAWTLSVIRGAALALLMAGAALPMAQFFDEPRIEAIVYILALVAFIEGLANVGTVDFEKHLRFHKTFQLSLAAKLTAFSVTIALAFLWRDYWALVAGMAADRVMRVVLSYAMHPYRPRASLASWRPILDYSKWMLGKSIVMFARQRSDVFVLGKLVGASGTGLYTVAYEVANLVTSELMAPIRRAIFPGFAKLAHDSQALRKSFIDSLALIVMLSAPVAIGMGLVADPLVRVALGAKWVEAIPLLQVLAIYGLANTTTANTNPLLLAMGRPNIQFYIGAGSLAVLLPSLVFAVVHLGLLGAAIAVTGTAVFTAGLNINISTRLLGLRTRDLLAPTWRSFTACGMMAAAVWTTHLKMAVPPDAALSEQALLLGLSIFVGALTYFALHVALWRLSGLPDGPEASVLEFLRDRSTTHTFRRSSS